MDIEVAKNWKRFEIARERIKDILDELDGDAFMAEEIDVSFEYLEKSISQLKSFWETKLKK